MKSKRKKRKKKKLPIAHYNFALCIVICALLIILARMFLIESYRITGNRMGETISAGDYILVNKLKGKDNPGRNRLVLYKSPLRDDASKPPLLAGRCIGLPGDVVLMSSDGFRINGRLLPNAPMMQPTYRISKNIKEPLLSTLDSLRIPYRNIKEDSLSITLRMSLHEKELLVQNLPKAIPIEIVNDRQAEGYEFVLPRKGVAMDINEVSLMVCKEAIMKEAGESALIRDGKLYINGVETTYFFFSNDYYWILSENETEGIDSRHLGPIPGDHINGNIWYCWYSNTPSNRLKRIN